MNESSFRTQSLVLCSVRFFRSRSHFDACWGRNRCVDVCVVTVLDVLEETKIAGNTLVVFSSDNGGALEVGANNGKLRSGKGTMYEGGLRVPSIARWIGTIKPGIETTVDATTADLFPTFLEVAHCEIRPRQSLDGVSLMPVFLGREAEMPRRDFYFIRREGGAPFFGLTSETLLSGGWKLVHNSPTSPLELFDLSNDPYEQTDLAKQEPERFAKMFRTLQLHLQQGGRVPWQPPE